MILIKPKFLMNLVFFMSIKLNLHLTQKVNSEKMTPLFPELNSNKMITL